MKIKEIKGVLEILTLLYKDRTIRDGKFKFKIYKIYNNLNNELNDAIEVNYSLYEQVAIKDKKGNMITKVFDINNKTVEHILEDGTKAYYVPIKSGIKEAIVLIAEKDLKELERQTKEILENNYIFDPLDLNIEGLMNYGISCEDIDILIQTGVIKENVTS